MSLSRNAVAATLQSSPSSVSAMDRTPTTGGLCLAPIEFIRVLLREFLEFVEPRNHRNRSDTYANCINGPNGRSTR